MKLVRTFCEAFTITLIGVSCGAGAYLWWHHRKEWKWALEETRIFAKAQRDAMRYLLGQKP